MNILHVQKIVDNKMKRKKYYIVGILQKSNRKWQKQGKLYL